MKQMNKYVLILIFGLTVHFFSSAQDERPGQQAAPEIGEKFKLGMAGWTFNKFDLDKTLETMERMDVHYLCIKSFHLPLNSTEAEIASFHAKCKAKGVTGYGVGPIYMKSKEEVDKAFEYARKVGVKTIVGVPNYDLLSYVEEKIKAYDMNFAIHLHGPDIDIYQDADAVWEKVKNFDERLGMCLDIGHDTRNGKDPVADLKKYAKRVHDIHLKDVTGTTKLGYSLEVGRGVIDIPAFVRMLREVEYSGVVSLEHEKDKTDPFMGIAESIGYFRGVVEATK